eukprot:m.40413 g.40413  ORF g.40413 m.40413 type:complete len:184 (-) comp14110_c0_seq1:25-576(-)
MRARFPWLVEVVLYRPQIHWNTGNAGRTCLGFNTPLHLIKPLGFSLDDRHVRRSGLDYWEHVDVTVHETWEAYVGPRRATHRLVFISKQSKFGVHALQHTEFFPAATWAQNRPVALVFGSEIDGLTALPPAERDCHPAVFVPMFSEHIRSFNLSSTVALVLWQAQRELLTKFPQNFQTDPSSA